jgi:hypothetical protein
MTQRRQNPGRRLPFNFNEKDIRRIREAIEPHFMYLTDPLNIKLPKDARIRFGNLVLPLFPNRKIPADFVLRVKAPRKGFNLRHAEKCIAYLGLDDDFKERLLRFYRKYEKADEMWRTRLNARTPRSLALRALARWFAKLRGEKIRGILTQDDGSAKRWEARLREKGLTWEDVMIPAPVAARVVVRLFKQKRDIKYSENSLKVEFSRLLGGRE